MRTKEDAKGVIEKSLRDKFTLLFLNSTKISEKLMKSPKKEDKIKGVDLFFKITRNFTYCCKNNILCFWQCRNNTRRDEQKDYGTD